MEWPCKSSILSENDLENGNGSGVKDEQDPDRITTSSLCNNCQLSIIQPLNASRFAPGLRCNVPRLPQPLNFDFSGVAIVDDCLILSTVIFNLGVCQGEDIVR